MKLKFLFMALVCCLTAGAQTPVKPEPLHEILIFKWAKDRDSVSYDVIVVINADGKVKVTERNDDNLDSIYEPEERFDAGRMLKSSFDFINQQKIVKTGAELSMGVATEPEPGRQALHIHFTTVKDYNDAEEGYEPAEYFTVLDADFYDHAPAALFSTLSLKDAALLRKLLYPDE